MIQVDTSFLVDILRETKRGSRGPATNLLTGPLADEQLAVSVHVLCELSAGAELASNPMTERKRVQELASSLLVVFPDGAFAATYGRLLAQLRRVGEPVGVMDLLVATSAVVNQAPLVTRDTRHFSRIPGLDLLTY